MRTLAGVEPSPIYTAVAVHEAPPPNKPPDASEPIGEGDEDAELERRILECFRQLPEEWQMEAVREVEWLQRYSTLRPRIIGNEEEELEEEEGSPDEDPEISSL